MMKKLVIAAVLMSAVLVFAQKQAPGKIHSVKLDDGNWIVLNMVDSTWQYEKSGYYEMDDDGEYVDAPGGKIMWVRKDGTWTYVKVRPRAKANKMKEFPSLNVTGTATNIALDVALKQAVDGVYNKGAADLRKHISGNIKNADKFLQACLRDRVKENDVDQSYKQLANKQWQVNTKISLHPYQVKPIMDCFEDQLEADAPAAAPAAK